jgi:hypothetical protein
MVPMAARIGYGFREGELELYQHACVLVGRLPEDPELLRKLGEEEELRCHELARAVGRLLKLEHQDGRFGTREHSWLWVGKKTVLDVYVPGSLPQVQLITYYNYSLPWMKAYVVGQGRSDIREKVITNLLQWWEP